MIWGDSSLKEGEMSKSGIEPTTLHCRPSSSSKLNLRCRRRYCCCCDGFRIRSDVRIRIRIHPGNESWIVNLKQDSLNFLTRQIPKKLKWCSCSRLYFYLRQSFGFVLLLNQLATFAVVVTRRHRSRIV